MFRPKRGHGRVHLHYGMLYGDVVILDECGSTNVEAASARYRHGDSVIAVRQTAGRGQRGHNWSSAPGENLTFSMVLKPEFLPVARQFLLSEAVALGVVDTLAFYGIDARIKWTNDIYVGDRKICGMLIENQLNGERLARSVAGIGLNINQLEFPEWVPNPCSMGSVTGCRYRVMDVFSLLYNKIAIRYGMLESGDAASIEQDYNRFLYRVGQQARFFIPNEGEVTGMIMRVAADGRLCVEIDGAQREFLFGQIEFFI